MAHDIVKLTSPIIWRDNNAEFKPVGAVVKISNATINDHFTLTFDDFYSITVSLETALLYIDPKDIFKFKLGA